MKIVGIDFSKHLLLQKKNQFLSMMMKKYTSERKYKSMI